MGKRTLYENAAIITGDPENPFIPSGCLLEENGDILAIGVSPDAMPAPDVRINLRGLFLMPGLISAHYHFYGQFARGMAVHKPLKNWQQVLANMWWDLDRTMDEDTTYHSTMMGAVEGIRAGITTFFDHQASPSFIDGSLDTIETALEKTGARAALAYEVTDRNGSDGARDGIRENIRYIKKHAGDNSRFKGLFGLHASYSLTPDTLSACAEAGLALGAGFHTHMAEDRADVADSYKLYNCHPVERLYRAGILTDHSICAHTVHVLPEHDAILRDCGVTAAHNVQSNTNNAVGICPVNRMLNAGVHVAIGGDGYNFNMFNELTMAAMMQHLREGTPSVFSGSAFSKLAFENPARLAGKTFGYGIGQLKAGAKADMLILDYDAPTPVTADNCLSHLQCGMGDHVDTVIINGIKVAEHRHMINLDEKEVFARTRESAARLWSRMP